MPHRNVQENHESQEIDYRGKSILAKVWRGVVSRVETFREGILSSGTKVRYYCRGVASLTDQRAAFFPCIL